MISQAASAAFVIKVLLGDKIPVKITFGKYSWGVCRQILKLGFSPFVIIAFDNILIITMNMVLQAYGGPGRGDMLVTCATIMQSFMLIVTMPLGGITAGTQSILGYNYGAKRVKRVRQAEKEILKLTVLFTAVMMAAAQTVSRYFVLIFTRNPEYVAMSVKAIRISTLMIVPLAFQYTFVDGFTGMGIAGAAISLSFFRKALFFLVVLTLPAAIGAEGVFWTEPIIDLTAAAVSTTFYLTYSGRILKKRLLEGKGHDLKRRR